ncbi:DUF1501 domain-containing protein [Erythrobacter sp. THAF29]|uniref:DUF1501 domain-containing protein n=1 Tax=Erythrobacter sp. THAF29 TaxID=2587851 RepID=UPI0012688F55|nr:DUF1501 domain-containing protein [Erythrobacter sp. THAF29]QFT77327.1 hypothetical protein FIU90_07205 [Erythrobacter sp. THAF29]
MSIDQLDRRALLAGTLALGASSLAMPRMAFARGTGSRNLMFVILRGAADGLAMLAPVGDPGFARFREPTLRDYEGARKADGFFAIHPSLEQTGNAYAQGEALFVHAAATSYRERSHFDGQNMLETGGARPYDLKDGWLNRLVGLMAEQMGQAPRALAIAPTIPLALRGDAPASNYAPSALPGASDDLKARVAAMYQSDPQLSALWTQALRTRAMAGGDRATRSLRDGASAGRLAARLMKGDQGARIGMVEIDRWDTHINQSGVFRRQAVNLDALLGAYREGMGSAWANTMVIVATEFGRTVRINGTNGTDHGTASAAIVLGGDVKGGRVIADWPGLSDSDLYEGRDLRPTIALQCLFAGAAAEHVGIEPNLAMKRLFPDHSDAPLTGIVRG